MSPMTIVCCGCGADAQPERIEDWTNFGTVPVCCPVCSNIFWVRLTSDQLVLSEQSIETTEDSAHQDLLLGSEVRIILREHQFCGEIGRITEKKYKHYRLAVAGRLVLIPKNGVEPWPTK